VKIGRLRRRITLLAPGDSQDPDSGIITSGDWLAVATNVPAAIEPLSAREFIAAGARQTNVTTRISIRWRDDVTATMRCADETGTIYAIEQVLGDNKSGREYLTLVCSQGEEQG
jgi:SPP1 family predicted phage head-tail adaptor